jgi:hypothetical protein
LKKEEGTWYIYSDGKSYSAEPKAVSQILELLNNMSTESIVATKEDKWADYEVDEEQAIIVELFTGDDLIETVYVGKFGFKQIQSQDPQQQRKAKMTSYVRAGNDDMVYAVDGILRMNFQDVKQSFRNRSVFNCSNPTDITKLTISSVYDELVLDLTTPEWKLNGMTVDSTLTAEYLQVLARITNSGFIDNVNVEDMVPEYTMLIEGNTFEPVTLKAYPADTTIGHYVTSTLNPGNVFDGSHTKLFEKVFVGKEKFLGN